jgi:uncharacterized protein YjiS (DUF1127 family)
MNPLASLFRRSRDRRAIGALLNLDDRMLRDIGLTRSDVLSMASRGRARRPDSGNE